MEDNKDKRQLPQSAVGLSLMDYLQAPVRMAQWDTIMGEIGSVQDTYRLRGEEIPDATKQRMARRIVAFRQQWQGYAPDFPLNEAKTLTEKECQEQLWSFNDLQRHHQIIEAYHGHPDKVPEFTRKAMAQEKQEYQREIAEYQAARKEHFKARLQVIRENQQQQKRKPK